MDQNKLENPQMYKGVVLEWDEKETVVLSDYGEVLKLHSRGTHTIGQQIYFFEEDICREKTALIAFPQLRNTIIGLGLAAAMLIFFVIKWPLTPNVAAVVSIDINPSIELGLDAKGIVISVEALNQDAVKLMQGIKVKGKTTVQAVSLIVLQAEARGYETEQQSVLLALAPTVSYDAELIEVAGDLEQLSKSKNYVFMLSKEAVTIKDSVHLSLGRTLLKEQFRTLDQDVITHGTIQRIFEIMNAQEDDVEDTQEERIEPEADTDEPEVKEMDAGDLETGDEEMDDEDDDKDKDDEDDDGEVEDEDEDE